MTSNKMKTAVWAVPLALLVAGTSARAAGTTVNLTAPDSLKTLKVPEPAALMTIVKDRKIIRGEIRDIGPGVFILDQRVHENHARAHLNRFGDFLCGHYWRSQQGEKEHHAQAPRRGEKTPGLRNQVSLRLWDFG